MDDEQSVVAVMAVMASELAAAWIVNDDYNTTHDYIKQVAVDAVQMAREILAEVKRTDPMREGNEP